MGFVFQCVDAALSSSMGVDRVPYGKDLMRQPPPCHPSPSPVGPPQVSGLSSSLLPRDGSQGGQLQQQQHTGQALLAQSSSLLQTNTGVSPDLDATTALYVIQKEKKMPFLMRGVTFKASFLLMLFSRHCAVVHSSAFFLCPSLSFPPNLQNRFVVKAVLAPAVSALIESAIANRAEAQRYFGDE